MRLSGEVKDVIYTNPGNGYTVIEVFSSGVTITAVGIFPPLHAGELVDMEGDFEMHKGYGKQFAVKNLTIAMPTKLESMKKYLASGLIRGLGGITASAIVNTYGEQTFEIMNYPMKLAKVKGISLKRATDFGLQFQKIKIMQEAILYLQQFSISINLALKIYRAYENKTEVMVRSNPYRLVEDIDGVGFFTADSIARAMGVPENGNQRVSAAIIHVLKDAMHNGGHTYVPQHELVREVGELLRTEEDISERVNANIQDMGFLGELKVYTMPDHVAVMLNKNYATETDIAKRLLALQAAGSCGQVDVEEDIAKYEVANSIVLHENQKNAVKNAINNGVQIITGGPGTGKTTIIKCIISILKNQKLTFALCAPTGRAAKRLTETTGEEAKTIHRALDLDYKDGKGYFRYDDNTRLPVNVVIVDEVSMVDEYVFYSLLKTLERGTRLILVGDKDQLPSVGAGNVLSDLISSSKFSVAYLTEIYRQDKQSLIVENAHRINRGQMFQITNGSGDFFFDEQNTPLEVAQTVTELCTSRLPSFLGCKPHDVQILCPMKRGVAGTIGLNANLQSKINPRSKEKKEVKYGDQVFREGDKVMQIVNNYQQQWVIADGLKVETGCGVFNGDIGIIERINLQNLEFTVRFDDNKVAVYSFSDLDQIVLSYAVSIHKSQGSEFDVVVVAVSYGSPMFLTRNLLYTAVTRAKKVVVLVGSRGAFESMIKNDYTAKRYTLLKQFLSAQG